MIFFFNAVNDEVPTQIFICSRGFSEADWNNAYATWCTAINYDEEEDDDEFDPDVDCPKMKASSENVNGYMREVDELALFEVEPDEIPSTLTGFSKNSILMGRENEEICRLDKKWYCWNGWIIRIPEAITISVKSPEMKCLQ